jgi:molybdopterin-guanine dinucleotide biosynthesis protein A
MTTLNVIDVIEHLPQNLPRKSCNPPSSRCSTHLRLLLLAGGQSTRMGRDKFLLPVFDKPLYVYLIEELRQAFAVAKSIHISLHNEGQVEAANIDASLSIGVILDNVRERLGPAAGLLAAHHVDPLAYWMVLACDYPLMTRSELRRLFDGFREPVTCFQNADGFVEPLVGIWGPAALATLEDNASKGQFGPSRTFKQLSGTNVAPLDPRTLFNANTREEWETALGVLTSEKPA